MLSSLSETSTQPCNIGTPKICTPLFSAALKIRDLFSCMLSSCHDRKHRHTLVLSIYDIPVLPEKNNKRITFFNHSDVKNYTLISFFKAAYCLVVESSMHVHARIFMSESFGYECLQDDTFLFYLHFKQITL